ncbi:AbiJ-NTD4 domain-containing protein [Oecophyllibacter saccharovorans]|uniref:HEPN AbiJ-N-terminal domain-containing protein n=1 Tax=Oecophyllibacter saccharovorans TaxID=2558360 RepID=A0A506URQ3_9PROT|nr:hypothetical protein [Oecophyllibacter saccharovorans]TPW36031.1 hypothetical protein E3202_03790 [Oecophyllibacter saccharovorans]
MRRDPSFSERNKYTSEPEINIRESAPKELRDAIIRIAYKARLSPEALRDLVCDVLIVSPNAGNWSEDYIKNEVRDLIHNAKWYYIYDIAEKVYNETRFNSYIKVDDEINSLFRKLGIGWQLKVPDRYRGSIGHIVARGSEAFELATKNVPLTMRKAGTPTAAKEMHEALLDLSKRPKADVTGAIQHALAGLECAIREYTGTPKDTLGKLSKKLALPKPLGLDLPRPLDEVVYKLWGYASDNARHLNEGKEPSFKEAEFVVTISASLNSYLAHSFKKFDNNEEDTDEWPF